MTRQPPSDEPIKSFGQEHFQRWSQDFQKMGLLRGEPQHWDWLSHCHFDQVSTEQLFLAHTHPPSLLNLDPECIYGQSGYAEMLEKLTRLAPAHFQITEISQHFYPTLEAEAAHKNKSYPVVALRCQINGQPFCCYLPRRNDFARSEFLWLLNQQGAEFELYGDWGDWFVTWCSKQQSKSLSARGWQRLDIRPSSDWLECQFQWALLQGHVPEILEELMDQFTNEHWTPAAWVYRGQYFAQQGDQQRAWENWSPAIQAGLQYPFTEVLDRLRVYDLRYKGPEIE